MKTKHILFLLSWANFLALQARAQDSTSVEDRNKLQRAPFESSLIIENQSAYVPRKGTLEMMLQHRFGTLENGIEDLYGIWAPSNIRIGMTYTLFDNLGFGALKGPLAIGIGTTKDNRIQDISWKYNFLRQTVSNKIPLTITYYGNVGIETLESTEELPNGNASDRLSYFHQLLLARRFSPKVSLQIGGSVSHYNVVQPYMYNDHFALMAGGRFKFSPQTSVMVNVDQPLTAHQSNNPFPNVSIGVEIATSAHSFQVFFTNYKSIVAQRNNVFNQNDPWSGWEGWLIGFNINRLWNF